MFLKTTRRNRAESLHVSVGKDMPVLNITTRETGADLRNALNTGNVKHISPYVKHNSTYIRISSTPCPSAKHGEEWGDPSGCENGDACQYCHTRTEQQFHPEIYKSTKCHDMQLNSYCPRGAFCAFAHGDCEVGKEVNPFVSFPFVISSFRLFIGPVSRRTEGRTWQIYSPMRCLHSQNHSLLSTRTKRLIIYLTIQSDLKIFMLIKLNLRWQ